MLLPLRLLETSLKRSDGWNEYLDYTKSLVKLEHNHLRINCIESCRSADIIPQFLKFRVPNNGCFEPTIVHNFQRKLLKEELAKAKQNLEQNINNVESKRTALKNKVPPDLIPSVAVYSRCEVRETRLKVQSTHNGKLDRLSKEQERPLFNLQNTVKFYEINLQPPRYVIETLALGPKNPVLDQFDKKCMLADIDILLNNLKRSNVSNDTINDINILTVKYVKACTHQKSPRNLLMTKRYLKENNLLAVPFDKGTGICVMKIDTYKEKLMDILNLPQFEKVIQTRKNAKDPILKEEQRINDTLQRLNKEGKVNDELYAQVKSIGGQAPRLYGLAKVHKTTIPMRPVLSMPGSPYYKLATKVTDWLSVLPEAKTNCSSRKTVEDIKDIKLDDDEVLVSFDVSSLYTNVPVKEAIKEAAEKLYAGNVTLPPVDKETFIVLAELATTDVLMWTHDGYYRQTDGLAMGAPPAPPLANLWLNKFDPIIKDEAKLYERYVDDVIREIKVHLIQSKIDEINRLHPNLKFTHEVELEGRISFLDLSIIHDNRQLSSTWYTKPTDTSLIMNFHALAPKRYKKSVVEGFVHRIYNACSSWELFDQSIKKAKAILELNQYPEEFYEPIIHSTLNKLYSPKESKEVTNTANTESPEIRSQFLKIQYRGRQTDHFVKKLKETGAPVQSVLTLRKLKTCLPSLKAPVEVRLRSNTVYKITCPGCGACYVGQSSRHLCTRFAEHRTKKSQPVRIHFEECGVGQPTSDDLVILDQSFVSQQHLETLEALYIREMNPKINTKDEFRSRELTIKF